MKFITYTFIILFSLLSFTACEKDGDKIYLKSLEGNELIASTQEIVLSSAQSQEIVLSFAWTEQTLTSSVPDAGAAVSVSTYLEAALTEDFSGTISRTETSSLSKAFTGAELKAIAVNLGAQVGTVSPLYFRLASAAGTNIPAAYSNVIRIQVTPYEIDMHTGIVVESDNSNQIIGDTDMTLYSPNADGIYKGFVSIPYGWYHIFLKEANSNLWGTAGDEGAFHLTNDATNNRQNMWFPENDGCYYVIVNTTSAEWSALHISSLSVEGLGSSPVSLTFDKENKRWVGTFNAEQTGNTTVTLSGNGEQWSVSTGTNSGAGISTPIYFRSNGENIELSDAQTPEGITVSIPQTGTCTVTVSLDDPQKPASISITAGGSSLPTVYPDQLEVVHYNDDGSEVTMTTLTLIDREKGIYSGQYTGDNYNFQIIDQTNQKWYGCDPNDNSKLSTAGDKWNLWFDGGNTVNVTITVNLSELTWQYSNADEYPTSMSMYIFDKNNWTLGEKVLDLEKKSEGIYQGIFEGIYNYDFKFVDNNSVTYGTNWSEENTSGFQLSKDSSAGTLWLQGYSWSEETVLKLQIIVDLTTMTWSFEPIN